MSRRVRNICVYCASSDSISEEFFYDAAALGALIGEHGLTLINGAGNTGLMRAVTDACSAAGGTTIGIIPSFMVERDWHHRGMTRLIQTQDIHQRQQMMAEMSDAAIVLAGGCGTLAELSELITWKQLGLYHKPLILLNTRGYWDDLHSWLRSAVQEHFMRPAHLEAVQMAATPDEALSLALTSTI